MIAGLPKSRNSIVVESVSLGCLDVSRASLKHNQYAGGLQEGYQVANYIYIKWQVRSPNIGLIARSAAYVLLTRTRDIHGITNWKGQEVSTTVIVKNT